MFNKNTLILKFQDLVVDSNIVLNKIGKFLGLEIMNNNLEKVNESQMVFSSKIQFLLRKITKSYFRNPDKFKSIKNSVNLKLVFSQELEYHKNELLKKTSFSIVESAKIETIIANFIQELINKSIKLERGSILSRDALVRMGWLKSKPKLLDNNIRKKLMVMYKDNTKKLSNLTGIDFSYWHD